MTDYYKILGISEKSTDHEIKAAYKKLAKQFHPDRNPGNKSAEEKFKGMSEAYNTLSDPKRRKEYDKLRLSGAHPGGFGDATDFSQGFDLNEFMRNMNFAGGRQSSSGSPFSDLFDGIFDTENSGNRRPVEPMMEISIPFEKSIHGGDVEFTLQDGSRKRIRIHIPKGIQDGEALRIAHTDSGTIQLIIRVQPDTIFHRKGDDIHVTIPFNFAQLVFGTVTRIQTVYGGRVDVKITPGTQSGTVLKLGALGVKSSRGTGDMFVTAILEIPKHLTKRQKDLLEEFARSADMKW